MALDKPNFVLTAKTVDVAQAFLTCEFRFRFNRFDPTTLQAMRGASHAGVYDQDMVTLHRDYFDVAEELFEKLLVIVWVMGRLKNVLSTDLDTGLRLIAQMNSRANKPIAGAKPMAHKVPTGMPKAQSSSAKTP